MNAKNVNKLVIIPLVFILVLTLSITYALFAKDIKTNRNITLSSVDKYIGIYGTNKNNIELNKDYTFTIENRGSIGTGYEIYIESETNINLSTITYQVTGDITASGNLSNSAIIYSALSSDDKKTITLRLTSTSTESYIGKIKVRYKDYIVNYNYTGGVQSFNTPDKGTYRVELWGAQGGSNVQSISGSPASYAAGDIYLNNEILSVKVGAMNGYNGGGASSNVGFSKNIGATGGGATDVRLSSEPESRIIVAGGGGGAGGSTGEGQYLYHTIICGYAHNSSCTQASTTSGGNGGGSYAGAGGGSSGDVSSLTTAAYGNIPYAKLIGENGKNGSFGQGGAGGASGMYKNGLTNFQNIYSGGTGGGGGGGYFGGGGGAGGCGWWSSPGGTGGGGSSYISGHLGSIAITSAYNLSEKCTPNNATLECSKHYSNKVFTNTNIIDGKGHTWTNTDLGAKDDNLMPKPSGGYYAKGTGHTGNGYARITYIGN